jgi:ferredoxin
MLPDREGFLYPTVTDACIQCGHCSHICPVLKQREKRHEPTAFAAWNGDDAVRSQSGAGGVFSLLAEFILDDGGIVFGAAVDDDLRVRHIAVQDKSQLHRLRGSKLVQSDIGDSFQRVRHYLDRDRHVLFTGTPCQVDGLYRYLGEHPEKLLTCDILCSGAPSPGVWANLVRSMAYIKQKKPVAVQFCGKLCIGHGHNLQSQQSGVLAAVDGDGCHGNAAGHHHRGEQGVHTVEVGALAGHADDGQGSVGGQGAGQMGGHTGKGDENRKTALPCRCSKLLCFHRTAVGRKHPHFHTDAIFAQHGNGLFHNGQVTVTAHDHGNFFHSLYGSSSVLIWSGKACPKNRVTVSKKSHFDQDALHKYCSHFLSFCQVVKRQTFAPTEKIL